jgi:hypothetical protein
MNTALHTLRALLLTACLALPLVAHGCDAGTEEGGGGTSVCEPGETQTCVCPDGNGAQSCNTAGTGWDSCVCGGGGGGGGGGGADAGGADASGGGQDVDQPDPPEDTSGNGTPEVGPDCTPSAEKACDGDTLVWLDSCGAFQENIESCAPGGYCADGACVAGCTPHAEKRCVGNDVHWFDSCGAEEGPAEVCDDDEFCDGCQAEDDTCAKEGQCVKAVLTGTWHVTADPDTKDACGMGNATFLPVMMDLQVDGTTVTGHADILAFSIDYAGTLDGKHLTMTGTYSESETIMGQTITIDHTENYDVYFSDLETFSGTNEDSFVMALGAMLGDIPCSLYWTVTGVKQ